MIDQPIIEQLIHQAIIEDLGDGDHTSLSTIPANARGKARLIIKEDGILAGMPIARKVFHHIDPEIEMKALLRDGAKIKKGDIAFTVEGPSISLLSAERLVLNFLQRMSGIATATWKANQLIKGTRARLLDTRKTTPNMRLFEKYAVLKGGGQNHRMGLFDMILIKDNHVDFAGGINAAIDACHEYLKRKGLNLKIEIEVRNFTELEEVLKHGSVDRIMLDNFSPENLQKAVAIVDGRHETEASGGISFDNLREYAETGVDFISIGALTHHIRSLDMSLKAMT
jgi:nicotinate-nucleotide pyrophosphorylase (carboxylating)